MRILIVGGSGFIGSYLVKLLMRKHKVVVLDIRKMKNLPKGVEFVQADGMKPLALSREEEFDAVVNLAGVDIFRKWNSKNMKMIRDSRVLTTRHLVDWMENLRKKPRILVQASAMGFYGDGGDEVLSTERVQGKGFLASVVGLWEREAVRAENFGVKVVRVRNAVVLGDAGYLKVLWKFFRFGLGAKIGDGEQFVPWVHIEDLVRYYEWVIENESDSKVVHGQFAEAVRQGDLVKVMGKVWRRPVFLKVPIWFLRIFYGKVVDELNFSQRTEVNEWDGASFGDLGKALFEVGEKLKKIKK